MFHIVDVAKVAVEVEKYSSQINILKIKEIRNPKVRRNNHSIISKEVEDEGHTKAQNLTLNVIIVISLDIRKIIVGKTS